METRDKKLGSSFAWLNLTQFFGALNDNIFKLLLILFLIGRQGPDAATGINAKAGAVAVVPFLLFSAYAGRLADRYSKRDVIVYAKVAELGAMLLGCIAFFAGNEIALYAVLFLMCLQSAFFGPSKYGIIRELVGDARLARANSVIQACTYAAIIIGTAAGPFLSDVLGGRFLTASFFCVAVSVAGLTSSVSIERTPPAAGAARASLLFVRDIWRTLCGIRSDKPLLWTVIASAYFALFGSFVYLNVIPYGLEHLSLTKEQSGYLFVIAGIGVAAGALWAGRLSGRGIALGAIPAGAAGLALGSLGLGAAPHNPYPVAALLLLLGVSAGLYLVPINTYIQWKSPASRRAEIIAASTFLDWCGVLASSGLIHTLSGLFGLSAAQIFVILGVMACVPGAITIFLFLKYKW
jgi:acyl-[acyl-carrier-protein]-phospholipid O-acyltransferase/long-chain-fatty-acid--[acyl-carrier-protein] ligase